MTPRLRGSSGVNPKQPSGEASFKSWIEMRKESDARATANAETIALAINAAGQAVAVAIDRNTAVLKQILDQLGAGRTGSGGKP